MLKLWNYEAFVLLSCLVITIYETTATNIYKGIAVILLRLRVASHNSGCPSRDSRDAFWYEIELNITAPLDTPSFSTMF